MRRSCARNDEVVYRPDSPKEGTAMWQLELLGPPRLTTPEGQQVRLQGKPLLLLAYLAVEGPTSRGRLSSLLWPHVSEVTARNNLTQLLRRLHHNLTADLVQGAELLNLAPHLTVDVATLLERQALPSTTPRTFLEGVDGGDADLTDWRDLWRERLALVHREHLTRQADRLEREEAYPRALELARTLLDLTPLSEDAFRRVMRLHYLNNDPASALAAFEACRVTLRAALRTDPLPETQALADEINASIAEPHATPAPTLSRAPRTLLGRDDAWRRMEAAWAAGRHVIVSGAPGVGKSRLLVDFADTKGHIAYLDGRPGDRAVPYSGVTRHLRTLLGAQVLQALDADETTVLAELLPDFCSAYPQRAPEASDFQPALTKLTRRLVGAFDVTILDDLQYFDDATITISALLGHSVTPRCLIAFRSGELPPTTQALVEQLVNTGLAEHIEVRELTVDDALAFIDSLHTRYDEPTKRRIVDLTGGNPRFILDVLRTLDASEGPPLTTLDHLGVPEAIESVLTAQLARRSTRALHLARAAAILDHPVTIDVMADILGMRLLDAVQSWDELIAAGLARAHDLTNELLARTLRAHIPGVALQALHRATARALDLHGYPPALIAHHWREGGDAAQAARILNAPINAQDPGGTSAPTASTDLRTDRQPDLPRLPRQVSSAAAPHLPPPSGPWRTQPAPPARRTAPAPAPAPAPHTEARFFLHASLRLGHDNSTATRAAESAWFPLLDDDERAAPMTPTSSLAVGLTSTGDPEVHGRSSSETRPPFPGQPSCPPTDDKPRWHASTGPDERGPQANPSSGPSGPSGGHDSRT
ncbi:AAA family ATPase [Deinococcus pimensis]|uniref:AAA family ATPase n=1 Tax=Deinococcus pimensis TaxID=309888 RepID=UPI000A027924|nr:AAA family ATPase [Deinococcus pimensis]